MDSALSSPIGESSMATAEVKEEQKVYVCLSWFYDEGKHTLSWALSHFPKDETKIVATSIIVTLAPNHPQYDAFLNESRETSNKRLDKYVAQCAMQKFKAEKLFHATDDLVEGILELIDSRAIKNLVLWSPPNSTLTSKTLEEKANPSCKIWYIHKGNLKLTRNPKSDLTEATSQEQIRKLSMATTDVKEEQKVYVCLPWLYDRGTHILSWALNHFSKDETKIVSTSIHNIPTLAPNHPQYNAFLNEWRDCNKFLDKYVAQCAIQKFKAEKLIHGYCQNQESLEPTIAEAILELIDLRAINNLVMWSVPNSVDDSIVAKKANPTCKIWFIDFKGNLLFTRCPKSDLTEATSEEQIRREKQHQKEIEEIQKRENDKNIDLLKREIEQLKLENPLQRNELDKQKQQLREIISDLEIDNNKLKQERDNAIREQIRREKQHQKEIEEIQKRENDKNDLLKREIEQLKLDNQLQQNELDKQKQQLREIISDLEIDNNKLMQEHDNAIREQIRREKQHQKEIEEIQKRENDKNDLLKREIEQLKLENQLQRNELDKQKQQLREIISDLEIGYNKLKQERDNAIKEAQQLRRQKEHSFGNSDMVLGSQFSLRELEQATENFSDSLKIGEGGFGCVYKGSLRKTTVAIKKLNSESLQGLSEFQQEVAILNRVRHPNIVNLIGSCSEISTLVYEFLPNGNLEDRLTCADNTSSLTWQSRTRIISEICLGLVFLHSNKPHLVIHGDLKPANILLDANLISKLSDFGISRIINQSDTNTTALYHTTHPAGTFAYIDPQFLSTGELTPKSDVYSFGIIVLRLLTGKRALNIANEVQEGMRVGRFLSIVDKSAGKWPSDLAKKLVKLGVRCADISRRKRPDMTEVWATIEPLVKAASLLSVGSSTSNEEHVPSHFICPIMQEIMKNPCIAADGFTYEAEAIKTWLNGGHNTSPMTNLVLPHRDLIPNHVLRSAIQEWLQQHPQSN